MKDTALNHKKTTQGTHVRRANPGYQRSIVLFVVALLVAATAVLAASPQADAQAADAQEAGELRFGFPRSAETCDEGFTSYPTGRLFRNGLTGELLGGEYVRCVEPGFANITTESLCNEARIGRYRAVWLAEVEICAQSRIMPPDVCPRPLLFVSWPDSFDGAMYACFVPMMSNAAAIAGTSGAPVLGTPVCIESDAVQNHASGASLVVGENFRGIDGGLYAVVTGGDCTFGCTDGFDVNCDGKLGDFCAVELDRHKASDVAACLAALIDEDTV